MRLRVLRATFFDFPALSMRTAAPDPSAIRRDDHMGETVEKAAAFQTTDVFERLLLLTGGERIDARFSKRS